MWLCPKTRGSEKNKNRRICWSKWSMNMYLWAIDSLPFLMPNLNYVNILSLVNMIYCSQKICWCTLNKTVFNTTHDEIITEERMQWPQGQKTPITQASKRLWERNHTLNIRYHKKWSILLSKNKSKYLYFNESSAFCSAEKSQGVFYTFYLIIIPPI